MLRFIFQFGIEPYFMFNFSFQIGSQDCARVHNKTQINPDNELSLLNSRASSAATERTGLVTTLDRTSDGAYQAPQIVSEASESITTGETNVISCGRLCVLPRELRIIIFKMLLVSDEPIKDAHQLVNIKEGLVASKVPRVPGIDARLLRTCRKVYEEALPVLYEQNTFYFCSDWDISDFAHNPMRDLVRDELLERLFGYIVRPYGRMSLIRSVILRLGAVWPNNLSREALGQTWAGFLEIDDSPWSRKGFPALERLTLDLSDWLPGPGETEALNVQPLVQKFRRSEGLQELTVKGINDQSNLSDLKKGLVRSGGRFRVVARNDREIYSEIV